MGDLTDLVGMLSTRGTCKNVPRSGFNPLQYSISTRIPARYDVLTAWTGHVPFGMSIVDMVRPRVLVELGTHWGVSYCAFCEAVKELRLSTLCYAIDTWQEDSHAAFYTDEVLENLKEHHDERYSLFSKLVRSTFDDALQLFKDRTIDVLHIDGYHTYNAVSHDFETWLPKMTDRGVVLFHDIDVRDRESFGVWRFWDEVKQRYPHFEFLHCFGLGLIAVGGRIPEGLRPLLALPPSEQILVRQYFSNLGDHLTQLNSIAMQRANLGELLEAKMEECMRLEAARAAAAAEIEALEAARAAAAAAIAAMQARLGRLRYRAVDRAARIAAKVPVLPEMVRSTAGAIIRLAQKPGLDFRWAPLAANFKRS